MQSTLNPRRCMSSQSDTACPIGSSSQESSTIPNGNMSGASSGLLYHGSCHRCHHFHTAVPIVLEYNTHQRIFCSRCQHPLFGLGGNSTQVTLASVLTSSSWRDETESTGQTTVTCSNTENPDRPSSIQHNEGPRPSSPVGSQSSRLEEEPLGTDVYRTGDERRQWGARGYTALTPPHDAPPLRSGTTTGPTNTNEGEQRLRQRLKRLFRNFRWRGRLKRAAQPQTASLSASTPSYPRLTTRDIGVMTEELSDHPGKQRPTEATPQRYLERLTAHEDPGTSNTATPDTRPSSRERLLAYRHEKTLKRNALRSRRCNCTTTCFCIEQRAGQRSRTSPIESNQAQPTRDVSPSPQMPHNRPPHPPSQPSDTTDDATQSVSAFHREPSSSVPMTEPSNRLIEFVGSRFLDVTYRTSSGRESSIQLEYSGPSRRSTSSGTVLSEATTAVSSSLHRTRSLLQRRDRSIALLPDVRLHFSDEQHAEALQIIRRIEELGLSPAHRSTDQTDLSFQSTSSQQRHSSSSESAGPSVRASTAGLTRLTTSILGDEGGGRVPGGSEAQRPTPITEEPTPITSSPLAVARDAALQRDHIDGTSEDGDEQGARNEEGQERGNNASNEEEE